MWKGSLTLCNTDNHLVDTESPSKASVRSEDTYPTSAIDVEMMLQDEDGQDVDLYLAAMPVQTTPEGNPAEQADKGDREMIGRY
jgi:hypothetical protein